MNFIFKNCFKNKRKHKYNSVDNTDKIETKKNVIENKESSIFETKNIIYNLSSVNTELIINQAIKNHITNYNNNKNEYKIYLKELYCYYDNELFYNNTIKCICDLFDNKYIKPNFRDALETRNPVYILLLIKKYKIKPLNGAVKYVLNYLQDYNEDYEYTINKQILNILIDDGSLDDIKTINDINIIYNLLLETCNRCENNEFYKMINKIIVNIKYNCKFTNSLVNIFSKVINTYLTDCENIDTYKIKYLLDQGGIIDKFKYCLLSRDYDLIKLFIDYKYLPDINNFMYAIDYFDDCPNYHEEKDYIKSYKLMVDTGVLDILITSKNIENKVIKIFEKLFYYSDETEVEYIFNKIINNLKKNENYYNIIDGFNIKARKCFSDILLLDSCQYWYNYNNESSNIAMINTIKLILKNGIKISNIIGELNLVLFASEHNSLELILLLLNNGCDYGYIIRSKFDTNKLNLIDRQYRWCIRKNGLILLYNNVLPDNLCRNTIKFL